MRNYNYHEDMNTTVTRKPNAYNLRGALPTVDDMHNEYIGSIYGSAALGCVAAAYAEESLDSLRERCPQVITPSVRSQMRAIEGGGGRIGDLAMMRVNINDNMVNNEGKYWVADFGNAVYERVLPAMERLRTATANALGKCRSIPDINAFARLIVAQSFACEAADYVERRGRMLSGYSITTESNRRYSVPFVLNLMSARPLCHHLTNICREVVGTRIDRNMDLLSDPLIMTGCKAVLNITGSVETWKYARDKANELNHKTN